MTTPKQPKHVPKRFDVYWVSLDPTQGSEIQKTRPCVIISPDEMNRNLRTVIVAPLTSKSRGYASRVSVTLSGKTGEIVLDQLRTVDKTRLQKYLGKIDPKAALNLCSILVEMFGY